MSHSVKPTPEYSGCILPIVFFAVMAAIIYAVFIAPNILDDTPTMASPTVIVIDTPTPEPIIDVTIEAVP